MKKAAALAVLLIMCASCRYRELKEPMPFMHEVEVLEKIRFTLPENHTNKESWSMVDDYDHGMLYHLPDVWHGNQKGIDLNIQFLAPGSTQLTFVKRRYSDTVEIRKYLVTCKAAPGNR